MAVPKKRTGHSAQGKRRSNWKATKPEVAICPNCGQPVLSHTVCTACGQYKGKVVSIKDPNYVETVKEDKKSVKKSTAKKSSAKKEKVEEKVEEVVVAEEVKEEANTEEVKVEENNDTTEA